MSEDFQEQLCSSVRAKILRRASLLYMFFWWNLQYSFWVNLLVTIYIYIYLKCWKIHGCNETILNSSSRYIFSTCWHKIPKKVCRFACLWSFSCFNAQRCSCSVPVPSSYCRTLNQAANSDERKAPNQADCNGDCAEPMEFCWSIARLLRLIPPGLLIFFLLAIPVIVKRETSRCFCK